MAEDKGRPLPPDESPTLVGGVSAVRSPGSGSSDLPPPSTDINPHSPPLGAVPDADLPTLLDYDPNLPIRPAQTAVPSGRAVFVPSGDQPILHPGTILAGRYEIVQVLGEGGMGAVYKAHDRELRRDVALKVIRPELASNPAIVERFKQELRLSHQVTHRNVIRIYDLGEGNGVKFITMEYIEGQDLRTIIREKEKFAPEEAVDVIKQVCQALDAAHSVGIIHRDLKPQNIMRDASGRILVMDFGLARTVEGDGMTQSGALVGTMEYMSPEQALGKPLDQRSDIFALGLILYEMLSGKMPFVADSGLASLIKRTQERAAPVSEHDATIPGALSGIVSKCLERDLDSRYQTVSEVLTDLNTWQDKRAAGTIRFDVSVGPWARTIPWPTIGVIATVVVLAVCGYLLRDKLFGPKSVPVSSRAAVSVLVGDFQNNTADPLFDDTLEPMFNVALEGASFINTYNRGNARRLANKLPNPVEKLDEQTSRLVAVNEGVAAVVTGSLSSRGSGYTLSVKAVDAVTGKTIATTDANAASKDELLMAVPKLAAPIRKALGDTTPESVQLEMAAGAFSTSSLAAVHQYGLAMEQLWAGNSEQAVHSFTNAIALDPNFARAYGGMASAYGNLGKTQDAEKYVKLAMEHVDRMTERERYRVRGLYYYATSNYPKCIEEYGELVERFPADNIAWGNMGSCYVNLRRIPEAVSAVRRAVEITPRGALQRLVLSFYSSYAGDFVASEREARKALELNPSPSAYLALAEAQLGLGQITQAAETYQTLQKTNEEGASIAASGLADLASYEGRYADSVRILEQGIAADVAAKNTDSAAEKLGALAQLQIMRGQKGPAVGAATKALAMSQSGPVRLLAGRSLVEAGETAKAQKLADSFASELQPESQAYGKIIRGDLALQRGDKNEAIKMFTDANQLLDTWIGRFELGRAYLEAGQFVEADSEFDRCMKRRGEALEMFMDDVPTFAYFPPVYYYRGRVREGLNSPGFAEPYRTYLSIRGQASEDSLLADIHRRLRK